MIRLLLAIIILTVFITYAIIPLVKYILKFGKLEAKRIEKSFNIDDEDKKEKPMEEIE